MIYLENNQLVVQGYQKLLKVSEEEIVFIIFHKTIIINGKDLSLPFFEKDEFKVKGKIDNIELHDN